MLYKILIVLVASVFASACGGSGSKKQPLPKLAPEVEKQFSADPEAAKLLQLLRVNQTAAFVAASDLAKTGNCVSAVPVLQCLAREGQGAAPAQFLLGECLLKTQQASGSSAKGEGVAWIMRAANGGLLDAQRRLFTAYQSGTVVPLDRARAQKWLVLAETNQLALSLGRNVETDYVAKRDFLQVVTEDEKSEGDTAAANWRRSYWTPQSDQDAPDYCLKKKRNATQEPNAPGKKLPPLPTPIAPL